MKSTIKTISAWSFAFLVCALASTLGGDPAYAGEAIGFDIGTAGLIGIGGIMVNAQTLQAAQTSFKTLFQVTIQPFR